MAHRIEILGQIYIGILDLIQAALNEARKSVNLAALNSISVFNKMAVNGARDGQVIKTVEITIPVIRADVLSYAPGELGSDSEIGRDGAKVLYSEEALKDPEYLESVMSSPFSVTTHEKNTNENNRDVDGWPNKVWFDENDKTVYAKGFVIGEDNVEYVKDNRLTPGFGTSAFIKFLELKKENGVSSTGVAYDAVATKMQNNHIAILPNIRDKKNVIVAVNAIKECAVDNSESREVEYKGIKVKFTGDDKNIIAQVMDSPYTSIKADGSDYNKVLQDIKGKIDLIKKNMYNENKNTGAKNMEDKIDKGAVKDALNEIEAEKTKNAEFEDMKNSLKSLNEKFESMNKAKNEAPDKKDESEETKNTEDKDKDDEAANAKNAMASQDLIKDASELLGIEYKSTPTVKMVANAFGVTGKSFPEMVSAMNAKRAELKSGQSSNVEVKNSTGESSSLNSLMASM